MREIVLIGIGTGNPDHVTIEAIRALNAVDLVLIPRKGPAKADLAELRREICGRYLEGRARLVEFDLPVRDAEGEYRSGVADWHRAIAATYRALIEAEAGPDAAVALLVWGDRAERGRRGGGDHHRAQLAPRDAGGGLGRGDA